MMDGFLHGQLGVAQYTVPCLVHVLCSFAGLLCNLQSNDEWSHGA